MHKQANKQTKNQTKNKPPESLNYLPTHIPTKPNGAAFFLRSYKFVLVTARTSYSLQNIRMFSTSPEEIFKNCAVLWTPTIRTHGCLMHWVTDTLQADRYKPSTLTKALFLSQYIRQFSSEPPNFTRNFDSLMTCRKYCYC